MIDENGHRRKKIETTQNKKPGFWKGRFSHHSLFFNHRGPPVFKLHFFGGQQRFTNQGRLNNHELTLYMYMYGYMIIHTYIYM